jgi:cysteine-rich repeat protein
MRHGRCVIAIHRTLRVALASAAGLVLVSLYAAGAIAPATAYADELAINVLSNRADLISGGDALIEVVVPPDVAIPDVHVLLNGSDVTSAFGLDAGGRFVGLVDGMVVGDNDLEAYVTPPTLKQSAAIIVTNYPIGGPIFSGAQLLPWICARKVATSVVVTVPSTALSGTATTKVSGLDADPVDDQCNAPSKFTFYYQPKALEGGSCTFTTPNVGTSCFQTYDLNSPPAPADIADFTNDAGHTVKSIIVVERGTVDRGIYEIVTFYDPTQPNTPQAPQQGWNGKLLWSFGAASGPRRFEMPPTVSVFNANALSRGFMIASGSLTDHDTNSNDTLAAEFMMMVKEQIVENYGEVRYTIGAGCSGGSILQYNITAAYPGLLNGIQPNCTFPDTLTTAIEVTDCGLLTGRYYTVAPGNALSTAKRTAINGHANANQCAAWVGSFLNFGNPTLAGNCGSGFPTSITYDPVTRGNGVRCTSFDHDASMLGTYVDVDGNAKAQSPIDNVGVQYGLKVLAAGTISAEEFVQLNEGVGSFTSDLVWVKPQRSVASAAALDTAYTGGLVSDGRQLAKAAIIDLRGNQGAVDIHLNWRALEVRSRLDTANGHHNNQVIWASGGGITPGAALLKKSFLTMDQWLTNIESDPSNSTIQQKIVNDKPATATDMCITTNGATDAQIVDVGIGSPSCPVTFQSSPHQVAGGPLSEDIFKCQLKPLDLSSPDYNGVVFSAAQQARLAAVFPDGVCDWTLSGVGQQPSDGGTTFKNGPGGEPLGDAPASSTVPPVCGDNVVIGEECDDGNTLGGDGCSATCTVEAGFTCTGSPSICTPICGDGLVVSGEGCDDGNTTSGDGCASGCTVETGWTCGGAPSACTPICGDGLILGAETCDDGNTIASDGCSATCTVESGYSCTGSPSSCSAICGDGIVIGGEGCDDANLSAGDGCSATCTVETGWDCVGAPSACTPICGDSLVRGNETCDHGAGNSAPGSCCSTACQLKPSGASCDDGNACTTSDTCDGADSCLGGPPPNCDDGNVCTADSCNTSTGCVHNGPARDGFSCDDGDACTQGDTCSGGVCLSGASGADSDDDGYCDNSEVAAGCDPNDGMEIPPQSAAFGGVPVGGIANFLITYLTPTSNRITKATDPSCAAVGVCAATGFCSAGKIADPCSTNADCNQPANTCRIVANYAAVPDLAVRRPFTLNRAPISSFGPLTPGCSRKVDVTLDPSRSSNVLKLIVTGTVNGHLRRDSDVFKYR